MSSNRLRSQQRELAVAMLTQVGGQPPNSCKAALLDWVQKRRDMAAAMLSRTGLPTLDRSLPVSLDFAQNQDLEQNGLEPLMDHEEARPSHRRPIHGHR